MIQGAGNYVPHEDGNQLLVLFPRQDGELARRFRAPDASEICAHAAFLHLLASHLSPDLPSVWTTLDISGHWVTFDAEGPEVQPMALTPEALRGIPSLEEILDDAGLGDFAALDATTLPMRTGTTTDRLKAGFYANQGVLGSATEWEAPVSYSSDGWPSMGEEAIVSNTHRLELGHPERLFLRLREFAGDWKSIELHPVAGQIDVWVRHFCDMRPPAPPQKDTSSTSRGGGADDQDFPLNYILRRDAAGLAAAFQRQRPPVPHVLGSWVSDDIIGIPGRPQCLPAREAPATFTAP